MDLGWPVEYYYNYYYFCYCYYCYNHYYLPLLGFK